MYRELQPAEASLPTSIEAETTLLGAMMVEPMALLDALARIQADDFALDSHRRIFSVMEHLFKTKMAVDIVTVANELRLRVELDSIGGRSYLASMTEGIPRRVGTESYIRIIQNKAKLRRLIHLATRAHESAYAEEDDAQVLIDRFESDLRGIRDDGTGEGLQHVRAYLQEHVKPETMGERLSTSGGLKTGFTDLDEILDGGLQPGELVIVAARPSMGKSAWAANVGWNTSVRFGKTVAAFTLEQSKKAYVRRMLSSASRIDYKAIRTGKLRQQDIDLLLERREMLYEAALYIDDSYNMTVSRIRSKCARLKMASGLDLVLIDQLSHISPADVIERGMQKPVYVGLQVSAVKRMAQELGVPVVLFNQLSREVGKRSTPVPQLSDLAESGRIEQDADVVIFLHRPEYYDKQDDSLKGKGQMIVAKNREGETATVHCGFQGRTMTWENLTQPKARQESLGRSYDEQDYFGESRF